MRDTLRPNGNGTFNNWDDNNTAGCAATASNYLRVNTASASDTISVDVIAGVCNNGNQFTSHTLADFTEAVNFVSLDSVRVRVKLWGTVATDSARIGIVVGTDSIWSALFAVTTTPTFYEFVTATDALGNPWDIATFNNAETAVHSKLGTNGRIWDTEEIAVVVWTRDDSPPTPPVTANRFYFPSTVNSAPVNIRFGLGLTTNWNDTSVAGAGGSNWRGKLVTQSTKQNTVTAIRTETNNTSGVRNNVAFGMWISDPLEAQNLQGTLKGQGKYSQNNNAASATRAIAVYVINKSGAAVNAPQSLAITFSDANTASGQEFVTTTRTNRRLVNVSEATPVVLSWVGVPESGRVVVEQGYSETGTSANTASMDVGGDSANATDMTETCPGCSTSTATGITWVEFSNTLAFFSACNKQDTLDVTADVVDGDWWTAACSQLNLFQNIDDAGHNAHDVDATYVMNDVGPGLCALATSNYVNSCADFNSAFDTIDSVRMVFWARTTTATDSIIPYMKTTDSTFGTVKLLTTSYQYFDMTLSTKPGGGAWTDAAVDSLKLAWHDNYITQQEPRVTAAYAVVFYSSGCPTAGDNRRRRILLEKEPEEKDEKEFCRKAPTLVFRRDCAFVE